MNETGGANSPQQESHYNRRDFAKLFVAGTGLSALALTRLNAAMYQSIVSLNEKYVKDEAPDGVYWEKLKDKFLFQDNLIMMNNGTVGPMPKPVFNTLMRTFKVQACNPYDFYNYFPRKKGEIRDKLARFINASPDEIVITRNTTEGMNFIANGLDLKEGDEVLISSLEHPGGYNPWKLKEKRHGITVKEIPLGVPPRDVSDIVDRFKAAITPKTKVISISHTVYITGLITPLKELCDMAHRAGKLVFFHSDGFILDIIEDLIEIGVNALNCQVWCMGAEEVSRRFKGDLCFWGELDRQRLLPHGTPEQIRAAARQMVDLFWTGQGGLIHQAEAGADVPLENIRALLEAWRDLTGTSSPEGAPH